MNVMNVNLMSFIVAEFKIICKYTAINESFRNVTTWYDIIKVERNFTIIVFISRFYHCLNMNSTILLKKKKKKHVLPLHHR